MFIEIIRNKSLYEIWKYVIDRNACANIIGECFAFHKSIITMISGFSYCIILDFIFTSARPYSAFAYILVMISFVIYVSMYMYIM